jgi:hypothetical protein
LRLGICSRLASDRELSRIASYLRDHQTWRAILNSHMMAGVAPDREPESGGFADID